MISYCRFALKSSYDFHVNRCSLRVVLYCQICKKFLQYTNRCMLLAHIRSHVHQMTTLNLADIILEPLPEDQIKLGSLNSDLDDENDFPDSLKVIVENRCISITDNGDIHKTASELHTSFDKSVNRLNQMFQVALNGADDVPITTPKEIESTESQNCSNENCEPSSANKECDLISNNNSSVILESSNSEIGRAHV